MAESPYITWYTSGFLQGVADLTAEQIGVYAVVLSLIGDNGGAIDNDRRMIGRRFNISMRKCGTVLAQLANAGKIEIHEGKISVPGRAISFRRDGESEFDFLTREIEHFAALGGNNYRLRRLREQLARLRGTHTIQEWQDILARCGNVCVRCGAQDPQKDHIIPIHAGGCDCAFNLQPLCQSCNCAKGPTTTDYRDHG